LDTRIGLDTRVGRVRVQAGARRERDDAGERQTESERGEEADLHRRLLCFERVWVTDVAGTAARHAVRQNATRTSAVPARGMAANVLLFTPEGYRAWRPEAVGGLLDPVWALVDAAPSTPGATDGVRMSVQP
jgi:hypothetical protein